MEAPDSQQPPPAAPPRRFTRRTLFKAAGLGLVCAASAEAARVIVGTNHHTVIPGKVYRSAQLSEKGFARVIAEKKIRTVVNLRGCCPGADWYTGETRATHAAGISQEDITLSAKRYPPPGEILRLIEVLDHTAYPILFHCAQGADRTGLSSTIARLLLTDDDLATARRQMWPRYGHMPVGRPAVLDRYFDLYGAKLAERGESHTPERFRTWSAGEYCPGPFKAALTLIGPEPAPRAGVGFVVNVRAENVSIEPWHFQPGGGNGVHLRHLLATDGRVVHTGRAGMLARTVEPGGSIDLACGVPPQRRGQFVFHADLVDVEPIDLLDSAFSQYGSDPLLVSLRVR